MGEEFSGIGSKLFFFCPDNGKIIEHDLENNTDRVVRKSDEERRVDRIMSTPPSEVIVSIDDGGFKVFPTGFSASFACNLPGSVEAEALRDMMRREMPDELFDVQILPSLHKKYYTRAPRKLKKAMNHGGYYVRNTKWKRKAIALYNRYPEQSPFTICNAKIEIEEGGRACIIGGSRGGKKIQ